MFWHTASSEGREKGHNPDFLSIVLLVVRALSLVRFSFVSMFRKATRVGLTVLKSRAQMVL